MIIQIRCYFFSNGFFFGNGQAASDKDYQVQVIDMLGRIVYKTKLAARTTSTTIDLADYQNGIYYVELKTVEIRSIKKVVKQ